MELSASTNPERTCRLCGGATLAWAESTRGEHYERCPTCGLLQVATPDLPTPEAELARYREHNNQPDNADYRDYLGRFADSAVTPYVPANARILDFGSGPHPVLTDILQGREFTVTPHDPFFLPNPDALTPAVPYDAVVMVEVIEHLHAPGRVLPSLLEQLAPTGHLILRTGVFDARVPEDDPPGAVNGPAATRFLAWWYRRDPTHVLFLTPATIDWMQRRFRLDLVHHKKGHELVFGRR